jgi:soluble lytic murein transglycosylase-like protein
MVLSMDRFNRTLSAVLPLLVVGSGWMALAQAEPTAMLSTQEWVGYYDGRAGQLRLEATDVAVPYIQLTNLADASRYQQMLQGFIRQENRALSADQVSLIAQSILAASQEYQVDMRLITSIIKIESSFRSDAISSSNAIGLGQLKADTAKWLGVVNPYDPIDNVAGTTRYLKYLLTKFNGSLDLALAAYFQGQGTISKYGLNADSEVYLRRVSDAVQQLEAQLRLASANPNS